MTTLRSTLWQVTAVGVLALHVNTWTAEAPLEMIRTTVNQAVVVLQNPSCEGTDHRQRCRDQVREIVLPRFDAQEMAKRVLGIHWRNRTEEEKKEFTQLFTALVETSYLTRGH